MHKNVEEGQIIVKLLLNSFEVKDKNDTEVLKGQQ